MELKDGDIIYIKDFLSDKPEFYCRKYFKDLIGFPTKVSLSNDKIYVKHPTLDLVPLSKNCVDYNSVGHSDESISRIDESDEPILNNTQKKLLMILIKFQNGDIDLTFIESAVGGLDKFLMLLSKNNLLNYIDPFSMDWDDYQNQLFYLFYQNDKSFIWTIVDKLLSDVTKIGDDYYFDTSTSDLAGFFETNYRSEISRTGIEDILSGEYNMDFWDVTDNVYRDVYDELTNENKQLVKERITLDLKDIKTIGTDTELLEEIAQEQGRDDVELTDEVISRILDDDDTIEYLINKELDDVSRDLYSLYSNCYSGILSDEWYDSLMSELVGFVIDDTQRDEYSYNKQVWDKDSNRVEKTFYGTRYKATKCIYEVVSEWLEENKNCEGGYCDTIEYFGSYDRLLSDLIDDGARELLRVPRLDEYPDHRKLNSCVNGNIGEYF